MWWPCVEDLAMCCNRPQGIVVVKTGLAGDGEDQYDLVQDSQNRLSVQRK